MFSDGVAYKQQLYEFSVIQVLLNAFRLVFSKDGSDSLPKLPISFFVFFFVYFLFSCFSSINPHLPDLVAPGT